MSFDFQHLGELLVIYGIHFLGAIVIALIGWWAAGFAERATRSALMRLSYMDPTVGAFLSSLVYYAVFVVAFAIILQIIGVQATSLVAILGATTLAIGLALQGTLSNVAAGVMLLVFRPFRLGNSIEVAGKSGTVKNLNLFMTELATGDNVQWAGMGIGANQFLGLSDARYQRELSGGVRQGRGDDLIHAARPSRT